MRLEADVAKGKAEAAKGGVFGENRAPAQGSEKGYNLCSNAALSREPRADQENAARVSFEKSSTHICARTLVRLSPALLGIIATTF